MALDDLCGERGRVSSVEPAQRHHVHPGAAEPGCRKLRPEGDNHKHRKLRHLLDHRIEQFNRARVRPMRVFEQKQQRVPTCQARQPAR
jgi:hypothetical protein